MPGPDNRLTFAQTLFHEDRGLPLPFYEDPHDFLSDALRLSMIRISERSQYRNGRLIGVMEQDVESWGSGGKRFHLEEGALIASDDRLIGIALGRDPEVAEATELAFGFSLNPLGSQQTDYATRLGQVVSKSRQLFTGRLFIDPSTRRIVAGGLTSIANPADPRTIWEASGYLSGARVNRAIDIIERVVTRSV